MIDHDNLEEFRDPQTYDLEDNGYDDDWPLTEQWARSLGGPLLDLACGTGRMALRLAAQGYQVTGVDIVPEMIEWARQKAAKQAVSIDWVVADARTFHLQRHFPFIYMLENVFQFFLTREDQEAMLARVREHLHPEGCFLFETRNPSPRNLLEVRHPEPQTYTTPDRGQLVIDSAATLRSHDPNPALHPPFHVSPQGGSTRGEDASHGPALCLSPRDGSLALLQWVSDPLVLRQLAARSSDRHFSLDDLCLPETCLACRLVLSSGCLTRLGLRARD